MTEMDSMMMADWDKARIEIDCVSRVDGEAQVMEMDSAMASTYLGYPGVDSILSHPIIYIILSYNQLDSPSFHHLRSLAHSEIWWFLTAVFNDIFSPYSNTPRARTAVSQSPFGMWREVV